MKRRILQVIFLAKKTHSAYFSFFQFPDSSFSPSTCLLAPDTGFCQAYFMHWAYHADEGKCKEFVYGGCDGNGNRFMTEEQCMNACGHVTPEIRSKSGSVQVTDKSSKSSGFGMKIDGKVVWLMSLSILIVMFNSLPISTSS
jgi:hypothetical protein